MQALFYVSGFISVIFLAVISALFLLLSLKIFKVEKRSYAFALLLTFIVGIINALSNMLVTGKINSTIQFVGGIVVSWAIIALAVNAKYKTGLPKSTLIWLVWAVINFILGIIFSLAASFVSAFIQGFTGAT